MSRIQDGLAGGDQGRCLSAFSTPSLSSPSWGVDADTIRDLPNARNPEFPQNPLRKDHLGRNGALEEGGQSLDLRAFKILATGASHSFLSRSQFSFSVSWA